MELPHASVLQDRHIGTDEEAGTSPGDRLFRPDVEGLRAVAVVLVVLYHAHVPALAGGYVGVDVFFVISGFVITGLLIRERDSTGTSSLINFYARRVRRILPEATLVLLATVTASYLLLGYVSGDSVANDGRWAAVFLSNVHFERTGTNYLSSILPPSPLQNYWSLSVEEQFYIVFPTIVALTALARRAGSRFRLTVVLAVVIAASYSLSVVQTNSNPTAAYFSPLTRSWELALGGLVAVASPALRNMNRHLSILIAWSGMAAIAFSAFAFSGQTNYPGAIVAIPVVGTALAIVGGTSTPRLGPEIVLRFRSVQWLGRRSYSWYLWHWPILVIAAGYAGETSLSTIRNLLLVAGALAISSVTYSVVENPIRHQRFPSIPTVLAGITLTAATVVLLSLLIASGSSGKGYRVVPARNIGVVLHEVASATRITSVPSSVEPALTEAANDYGGNDEPDRCRGDFTNTSEPICVFGDDRGHKLMVLYGDSHALMWVSPLKAIAAAAHWRLVVLGKPSCPAAIVTVANTPGIGQPGSAYQSCDEWHRWAVAEIRQLDPQLVVISEEDRYATPREGQSPARYFTPVTWEQGMKELFAAISKPSRDIDLLGNIPVLPVSGPTCLGAHTDDAQACSAAKSATSLPLNAAEREAARASGVRFIDPTRWFCSTRCTALIGTFDVYLDRLHVTNTYARYLQNVLRGTLSLDPDH